IEQGFDSCDLCTQRRNLQRLIHCIAGDGELRGFHLALLVLGERALLFDRARKLAGVVERVADGGTDREIRERRRLRQRSQELCAVLLTADAGRSIDLRPTPASSRTHELLLLFERPLGGCE